MDKTPEERAMELFDPGYEGRISPKRLREAFGLKLMAQAIREAEDAAYERGFKAGQKIKIRKVERPPFVFDDLEDDEVVVVSKPNYKKIPMRKKAKDNTDE